MEKEVKFEVGKWYYFELKKGFERVIKCISITDKAVYCDYWGMNGKLVSSGKNLWSLNNIENIKELSIEEIQQYLPEGHPDKIKSNQEFKVGDWCIWKSGDKVDIFKIYNIHNSGNIIHGDNGNHYDNDKIRHATPEEINNHLISIGEIPADEPLNTDSLKMILSIDDEELPMVDIIKTKSTQILNIE